MRHRLRAIARSLKRELTVYHAIARHPRTPRRARWLLLAAIGYALLPFDLIPDFLPVVGHLDDLVIVPGLILLALWSVPAEVRAECRQAVCSGAIGGRARPGKVGGHAS